MNVSATEYAAPIRSDHPPRHAADTIKPLPVWLHFLTFPISSQVTIGLAKIFDFEVLAHGTSITNCCEILKGGADPSKGGSEGGSTRYYAAGAAKGSFVEAVKNHFYVFKDSEAKTGMDAKVERRTYHKDSHPTVTFEFVKNGKHFKEEQFEDVSFVDRIKLYVYPKFHAVLAAISHTDAIDSKVRRCAELVFYGVSNFLFSPTLRFIYTRDETKKIFEDDPDYTGLAYRTSKHLPNNRIGLIGVCAHASLEGLKSGLQKRPLRVLAGTVHLLAGSILTYMGLGFIL